MNRTGHLTVGFIAVSASKMLFPEAVGVAEVGLVLFGSLLPDIDHARSTLGRYNPFTRWMKHRGKTHTILGSLLLSTPFFLLGGTNTLLWVFFGCMSHLIADKLYSLLPKKKPFAIRIW